MYNTMLRAFAASSSYSQEAIAYYSDLLRCGFYPDRFTFPFVIRSCSLSSSLSAGRQVHAHVVKFGLESDVYIMNNVIALYSSFGAMNHARQVFEENPEQVDTVSWTSLVTGYANSGDIDKALAYFDKMPCKNVVSWNAIISGHAQLGRIDEARELFDEMPDRDAASWGAMISAYIECRMFHEALTMFKEMVARNQIPNDASIVSAISASAHLRALEEGACLHEYIIQNKIEMNVILGTALLDMYGKCGSIDKALQVFHSMPTKNVHSWNSTIAGLAFNGFGRNALSLFYKMQLVGPTPNAKTFISLLSGCSHSGLLEEGLHIFNLMTQKYKLEPHLEHYGCMVDLLSRAGLIKEAVEFVKAMPIEPHPGLLGAIVGACKIHGEVEFGKQLGNVLVDLEPQHSGRYAILSNILASSDKWEDVELIGNLLKDRKVLKTPGNSIV